MRLKPSNIDKPIYQRNFRDEKILKVAVEDPLINIELDVISSLKQRYEEAVKSGYKGSFNKWIRDTELENLKLSKGGRVKLQDGGMLSRDLLISMLKHEYPSTYLRYVDKLEQTSTQEISDLLGTNC
jgi:hypothetical protein